MVIQVMQMNALAHRKRGAKNDGFHYGKKQPLYYKNRKLR